MKKPEYLIATAVIAGALLFIAALSYSIGKLRFAGGQKRVYIWVESAAGIVPNTQVKFAGAPIGRVETIKVLPRKDQEMNGHGLYCVVIGAVIDGKVEVGNDVIASIRQDGMLGSNYISFKPVSKDSPLLPDDAILKAVPTADINDITNSGEALITKLIPVVDNLQGISTVLNSSLPSLTENMNEVMDEANSLLKITTTPENKERLTKLLANLSVITDNMKVVTTNAKALTATLAQTPWRMVWGGKTNPIPPESEVLKSDKPIPIKNVIEVNPVEPTTPAPRN